MAHPSAQTGLLRSGDESDAASAPLVRRGALVPTDPLVSVCVLVLADAGLAVDCLDSIGPRQRANRGRSRVVANGAHRSIARYPLEQREDIVLVRSGTNLGFAGGNNLAAEVARGPYVLFLNDDTRLRRATSTACWATLGARRFHRGRRGADPVHRRLAPGGWIGVVERWFGQPRRPRAAPRGGRILLRA